MCYSARCDPFYHYFTNLNTTRVVSECTRYNYTASSLKCMLYHFFLLLFRYKVLVACACMASCNRMQQVSSDLETVATIFETKQQPASCWITMATSETPHVFCPSAYSDTPALGLIGLIEYSCQQVATSFPEAGLQRTPRLSVLGPEKFGDGWPTGKFFPGAQEWGQSVQKKLVLVCEDSLCPRKQPDVS